ncbi:MAG: stage II sporulation protein M [archaeon]
MSGKRKKNGSWFFEIYRELFRFLWESKNFIYFVIGLFIFVSVSVTLGLQNSQLNLILLEQIERLLLEFEGLGIFQTIAKIFLNNFLASFLGVVLGVFLGIPTVLFILTNGYMVGFVSSLAIKERGIFSLWMLLPHGIFELPAIFISFGLGLRLGMFILARDPLKELKRSVRMIVGVFLFIVMPLLIIAAVIEGLFMVYWIV